MVPGGRRVLSRSASLMSWFQEGRGPDQRRSELGDPERCPRSGQRSPQCSEDKLRAAREWAGAMVSRPQRKQELGGWGWTRRVLRVATQICRFSMEAQAMQRQCTCCQETRLHEEVVTMQCPDGTAVQHTYTHVDECSCAASCVPAPEAPEDSTPIFSI